MKKIKLFALVATVALGAFTQNAFAQFEGVIKFDKVRKSVTTKYAYYVKGDHIRVEESGSNGQVKGIMLVDLGNGTCSAIQPEKKLYMDVTNKRPPQDLNLDIQKTKKTKKVQGFDCEQWIVKDKTTGVEVTYWVAKGDFAFFSKMLKVINRKDNLAKYFMEVDGSAGVFTMLGTEKDRDGNVKTELVVTAVTKKKVDMSMFKIPDGFQKFEK